MAIKPSFDIVIILAGGEPHLAAQGMFARSEAEAIIRVWNAFEIFCDMTYDYSVHPSTFRSIQAKKGLASLVEW